MTFAIDHGADGALEQLISKTYDADGNLLSDEVNDGADEIVERRSIYTYDGEGNRLTKSEDGFLRPADGRIDHTWEYRPPCPREVWQRQACRDEGFESVEIPVE